MSITREEFIGTTQAKSDQVNACDLLGGPLVSQITAIEMTGSADQPVSIYIDSHKQPWKPSKTFRRVLAAAWSDVPPSEWVGRYAVIYCDPTIKWAGEAVGGVAISHLSHIARSIPVQVNAAKNKKKVVTVEPYYPQEQQAPQQPTYWPDDAFEKQYAKAEPLLIAGEKIADDVIAALETKALLSEGQKARLRRCVNQQPDPQYDEPPPLEEDGDPFAEQE